MQATSSAPTATSPAPTVTSPVPTATSPAEPGETQVPPTPTPTTPRIPAWQLDWDQTVEAAKGSPKMYVKVKGCGKESTKLIMTEWEGKPPRKSTTFWVDRRNGIRCQILPSWKAGQSFGLECTGPSNTRAQTEVYCDRNTSEKTAAYFFFAVMDKQCANRNIYGWCAP